MNDGIISGDNICECLNNHTLDEVVFLLKKLSGEWQRGMDLLNEINTDGRDDLKREIIRAEALGIQFSTAARIMEFYQARRNIFRRSENIAENVDRMRAVVEEEIKARKRMIELIRLDPVLGYNPEAGDYKYNEKTIRAGLDTMPGVKDDLKRIAAGDLNYPKIQVSYLADQVIFSILTGDPSAR